MPNKKNRNKNKKSIKIEDNDLDSILEQFKKQDKKEMKDLVLMGKWKSEDKDISKCNSIQNPVYSYDETLNPISALNDDVPKHVKSMRKAAEVHRQTRKYIQSIIQPGMGYLDVCTRLEDKVVELFGRNDLTEGIGFPTGFSVNHVAAHDSANPGDTRTIKNDDVIKIDFGTHCDGYIIDSAFTVAFNPIYEPLLKATKEATWEGIRMASPDVLVNDISEVIKETIESYEIEIKGKIHPIKAVTNLGGHNIKQYIIHGGKLVLGGPTESPLVSDMRMKAGECFAIETFATTGTTNSVQNDTKSLVNHYMLQPNKPKPIFSLPTTNKLYNYIEKNRSTLPFCTRWLEKEMGKGYKSGLLELESKKLISPYPPLVDKVGTFTSQWEHTIYLHDFGKEILSAGDDY